MTLTDKIRREYECWGYDTPEEMEEAISMEVMAGDTITEILSDTDPDEAHHSRRYQYDAPYAERYDLSSGVALIQYDPLGDRRIEIVNNRPTGSDLWEWAILDDGEDHRCERMGFGEEPETVDANYDDDCQIIIKGYYYDYRPVNYATDDDYDEPLIFTTAAEAQAWIDRVEEEPYYLAHGEAGRPTYYIVEAG